MPQEVGPQPERERAARVGAESTQELPVNIYFQVTNYLNYLDFNSINDISAYNN